MIRKISVLVLVLVLVSGIVSAAGGTPNSDADNNGCYIDAPAAVNEGVDIPVTVKCVGITTDNNVFGFQLGTSLSGDFVTPAPSAYDDGDFTSTASNGVLVGSNTLALYGASRQTADVVGSEDFTLGTYTLTAKTDIAAVDGSDGSVAITLVDPTFKLSDNYGLALDGWLRTINDATTSVNDIDLAWLSGDLTVKSDSSAIGNLKNIDLNLGGKHYTAATVASYQKSLPMDPTYTYLENAAGSVIVDGTLAAAADAADSDNTLNIAVTADMWGHLACSTAAVNLLDAGSAEDVDNFVGTSGAVTLKAGDANNDGEISNTDATIIGGDFGDSGGAINALYQGDMNLDSTINIFDLVQVGRNIDATTGNCS